MGKGKIKSFQMVCRICHKLQKEGKKVVFCHGFFDILHKGHVTLLVEAKKLGDILVVGVDHDDNAKILKGPERPINDHDSRLFVLANLEVVDFVFLVPSFKVSKNIDNFWLKIYRKLNPNLIASSLKAGKFGDMRKEKSEEINAKFVDLSDYLHPFNTTKIYKILNK